jgi:hypothetical protein
MPLLLQICVNIFLFSGNQRLTQHNVLAFGSQYYTKKIATNCMQSEDPLLIFVRLAATLVRICMRLAVSLYSGVQILHA